MEQSNQNPAKRPQKASSTRPKPPREDAKKTEPQKEQAKPKR